MDPNLENDVMDESGLYRLQNIFNEILKGNLGIIDLDNQIFLSTISSFLLNLDDQSYQDYPVQKEKLRYLLYICNVLYNRSDMDVLPVEDGVYDLLLEIYKRYDPNFQVGSAVVNLSNSLQHAESKTLKGCPIYFFNREEVRDDIRNHFREQLQRFDQQKYDYRDLYRSPITFFHDEKLSKGTHTTAHNHPDLVGTLDKCKFVLDQDAMDQGVYDKSNVKILERDFFVDHITKGIIRPDQELDLVLELKYDGVSVEADCNIELQSARTRGDTGIGKAVDITPILQGYQFPRNNIFTYETIGVKFEAIIKKSVLPAFNEVRGYSYKNCRTAIVGLFGNGDAYKYRDFLTLIPLAVDRNQVPQIENREQEIIFLNKLFKTKGEPLRYCTIHGNYRTCLYLIKKFAEEAKAARDYLDFMFDGIVVSYLDENIRAKLGRENYINKYSMAVKFDPLSKITTFLGYTYEVGQAGTITPMIHYAPVEFLGTIHPKSSGHSLDRFKKLKLKKGDFIEVTYTNDVMPYVTSIDCEHNRQNTNLLEEFPNVCPVCGTPLVFSDSGKSAMCPNMECKGRAVARMVNMLQKLNLKGFADSTIQSLEVYTFHDFIDLINQKNADYVAQRIGYGNASNLSMAIHNLITSSIPDYQIVGALGFTNCAAQTWKLIFKYYTLEEFVHEIETNPDNVMITLNEINGIGYNTAYTIVKEYPIFKEDFHLLLMPMFTVTSTKGQSARKQIRFSGCRNKQLEKQLCNLGYDADGSASVTKQTDILLVPYEGFESSKTAKVKNTNTRIIPITEFMEHMDDYLKTLI